MSSRTLILVVVVLSMAGSASASPLLRADQRPGTSDQLALGERVYGNCASCHGAAGQGRPGFAPRLASDDLLAVVGDDFLRRAVVEGRTGTQMPAWADRLTGAEIDGVVALLRSWQKVDGAALDDRPLEARVQQGEADFATLCASCHGPRGEGMAAGYLGAAIGGSAFLSQVDDPTLRGLIARGRAGTAMPPFGSALGPERLDGVVAWLRANAWHDLPWPSSSTAAVEPATGPSDTDGEESSRPWFGALPSFSYDAEEGLSVGVDAWLGGEGAIEWSVDLSVWLGVRARKGQRPEVLYQSYSMGLYLEGLDGGRLELGFSGGFDQSRDASWYGLGNASEVDEELMERDPGFYGYGQLSPWGDVSAQVEMARSPVGRLALALGLAVSWNEVSVNPGSRLAKDLTGGRVTSATGLLVGSAVGFVWDSTDDDMDPTRGIAAEISGRWGLSSLQSGDPGAFGGANASVRGYLPISDGRLVLATRLALDLGFGDVPFHLLSQQGGFEDVEATGGGTSIRGVWGDRRAGRIKALSNVELRARLVSFELLGLPIRLGVVGFVDAGRVWADYAPDPVLDGDGLGLAVGIGGGARLHLGDELIVRLDAAWSPSDGTSAVYLDFGHAF